MKYLSSSDAGNGSEAGLSNAKKQIDWNDYTYPPCGCIKMFHYIPQQVPQRYDRRVLFLKINHVAIIVALLLNILTNIIGAAQGVQSGGIRIGISFFLLLIWLPISFYLFITPMQIYLGGDGSVILFYIFSLLAFVWFFIWAIADFADANGFVQVGKNFNNGRAAAGFFGILTAIMMMGISILAFVNGLLFYRRD